MPFAEQKLAHARAKLAKLTPEERKRVAEVVAKLLARRAMKARAKLAVVAEAVRLEQPYPVTPPPDLVIGHSDVPPHVGSHSPSQAYSTESPVVPRAPSKEALP